MPPLQKIVAKDILDQPMLKGRGPHGGLAIILDYPSSLNWNKKIHVWGDVKRLLEGTLQAFGGSLAGSYITYAVPHPVKTKNPSPQELIAHHHRLIEELREVNPNKILVLGAAAHSVLLGKSKVPNVYSIRGRGEMVSLASPQEVFTVTSIPPFYMLGENAILFRDFQKDVEKVLVQNAPVSGPKVSRVVCRTPKDVLLQLKKLSQASVVSCDTETTGLDPFVDTLEAIGFGALTKAPLEGRTVVIPRDLCSNQEALVYVKDFLMGRTFKGRITFHNSKFDLKMLMVALGSDLDVPFLEDTILMNYVLDERPYFHWSRPHGLKNIARVRYDAEDFAFQFKKFYAETDPAKRDYGDLYFYLSLDLIYSIQLWFDLDKEIEAEGGELRSVLTRFLYPGTKAFVDIELDGVLVDVPYFEDLEGRMEELLRVSLPHLLRILLGKGTPVKFVEEFNPNSWQDVQEAVYTHLKIRPGPQGKKTGKDVLKALVMGKDGTDGKEFIDRLIEYKENSRALSTSIKGLLKRADSGGRVHGDFNVNGAATGRLSSSNPNFQNIPIQMGPVIRKGFMAPPGYFFCEIDYSQLELRVGAYLSQDPTLIKAFQDKRDIHREVASAAFNTPYDEVDYFKRFSAKLIGFGVVYGRAPASLVSSQKLHGITWTLDDAQNFIDSFWGEFKGLKKWSEGQHALVKEEQVVETRTGRRRRWDLLLPQIVNKACRQAVNSPIQGLASDFTLLSLIIVHGILKRGKFLSKIVSTVHDSLLLEIAEEEIDVVTEILIAVMENIFPVPDVNVPIIAECEVGQVWGEMEEYFPAPCNHFYHPESESWIWESQEELQSRDIPFSSETQFLDGPYTALERIEKELQCLL